MRMTIPKSQGKQPFYDARKSSWGDIFPHEPKNTPQERYQPRGANGSPTLKGENIEKRKKLPRKDKDELSYEALADGLKSRKKSIRDRIAAEPRSRWLGSDADD